MMVRTLLTVAAATAPVLVLAQVPAGGEFRVNSYTTASQYGRALAIGPAGNFVAAWQSNGQDASGYGIFARRFDASGTPLAAEFRVNTTTQSDQLVPSVGVEDGGDFVVTWSGYDSELNGAFAQRYDGSGAPRGGEFRVNTYTTGRQQEPWVASDAAGNFVVVWDSLPQDYNSHGVFGQRYDAAGTARGAEFRANTYTTEGQYQPRVASGPDGRFVVVWVSGGQDGSGRGVFGQAFSAAGAPIGAEFQANSYTTAYQAEPAVAVAGNGDFVVVWTSYVTQYGSTSGVFGQRFSASAARLGGEFRISASTTNPLRLPDVASGAAGDFVVAWSSQGQDGSGYGIFARRFQASGAFRGAEFQVNTYTTGHQTSPAVASTAAGNFVVSWVGAGQDGSGSGVFARRFGGLFPAALALDPAAGGGSNGNGVMEPGESVEMRPSWRNVNGAAQSFTGGLSGITGPAGATYSITDGTGAYGTVADGATGACLNCYAVAVSNPPTRPVTHWDASVLESIVPDSQGQRQRWALHVGNSFTDVPASSGFYRFIETLLHRSITGGCTGTTYCPANATTREEMAVFVLVAKEGAGFVPPACAPPNTFNDVPETSGFCRWIEELASRGVVGGCGGGNYCPAQPVTREQMAIFVLRTLDPALNPPACGTPMFADVPASSPFCRWIEELARRGVVSGCGGGNYCPAQPVTREQMGVFLSVTFSLTLYGP
jgi:S-layer family protein